jgi:hypothetical protein
MSRFLRMSRSARRAKPLSIERLEDRLALSAESIGQIGINFVGGRPGIPGAMVTGSAGIVPQSHWNNVADNQATSTGGAQAGSATDLLDSDGNATGASVSWVANNTWVIGGATPGTGTAQAFKGYLDTTSTSTTSVTFDSVPYSLYDVYVYFDGDEAIGRNGLYSVTSGLQTLDQGPYFDRANWPIGGETTDFVLADEPNEAGNYAVFRGLTGQQLTVTARPADTAAFRAPLNAIQIVGYPLPLVVNTLSDIDDGDATNSSMTLREAVNISNSTPGPALITFDLPAGLQTITLAGSELTLSDDVKIVGLGIEALRIDANGGSRVFRVTGGAKAELSGLLVTGGNVQHEGPPGAADRYGGGILNDGSSLTVERSWIYGNRAAIGGGIENFAHAAGTARLVLRDTTVSYNVAASGGGLDNNGVAGAAVARVINSTIAYNEARSGGGIYSFQDTPAGSHASIDVTNSTISGNTARINYGGMVNNGGAASVVATTMTKNRADSDNDGIGSGGGLFTIFGGKTTIFRSIVVDNLAPRDADVGSLMGGANTSLGHNLFHKGHPIAFAESIPGANSDERRVYEVPVVTSGLTWDEANTAAVAAGGHLATIGSEEEALAIDYAVRSPSAWSGVAGPWIGGRQTFATEPDGGWEWVTGEPMSYHDWWPGEPNDSPSNEDRLHLFRLPGEPIGWNDLAGAWTAPISYVIEYDALDYHPTDRIAEDPQLLPLADNGGPTWTHALPRTYSVELPRLYHDAVRRSGPVAWWHLDETGGTTTVDSAGNYHGQYEGSVGIGQLGAPIIPSSNLAADLDGGHVWVPYDAALNPPTFAVEAWVRPEAAAGGPFTIVSTASTDSNGNTSGYELSLLSSGNFELRLGNGTTEWTTLVLSSHGTFDWNGWNYIMAGYTANTEADANGLYFGGFFYRRERLFGTGTVSGGIPFKPNTVEPLRIGAGSAGSPFIGKIDEVAVYNRNVFGDADHDSRGQSQSYAQPWRITPAGPATQTSTWFDLSHLAADRALDGDFHTTSHTHRGDVDPQWQVDLGSPQPVGRIVLHNRRDCCASRLRDITVEVLSPSGQLVYRSGVLNPENLLGGGLVDSGPPTLTVDFVAEIGGPVIGKTVVVRRNSDPNLLGSGGQGNEDEPDVLSLAEVEIFLATPTTDQRGVTRPRGRVGYGGVNIGSFEPTDSSIVGRHVFYNNSSFDAALNGGIDDAAIATDKQPLRAGQSATFANYTSFDKGINGLMIDIRDLPVPATMENWTEYFEFRVGHPHDPSSMVAAPPPETVSTRHGAGSSGSDRITLIWPDGAIRNQWLEVTVKAGLMTTGLTADDVFYFGNAIGETGNVPGDLRVDFADRVEVLRHVVGGAVGITHRFDIDRDGVVNSADADIIEANLTAPPGDLDLDDSVGLKDLLILQANLNQPNRLQLDSTTFTLNGNVERMPDRLRLTQAGGLWSASTWTSRWIDFPSDYTFATYFAVDVHSPQGTFVDADGPGGDGMTFTLQTAGNSVRGALGGGLGLLGIPGPWIAVELDTIAGGMYDDSSAAPTHIGIDTHEISLATAPVERFNDGTIGQNVRHVWIEYDGGTDLLNVYFSADPIRPQNPTLSATVDLASLFGADAVVYAGFTAGVAAAMNTHDVLDWHFSTPMADPYEGDLDGDGDVDRDDLTHLLLPSATDRYGAIASNEMLSNRLPAISIPLPAAPSPPAAPAPGAGAAPADAALASLALPHRAAGRLAATRSRAKIKVTAVDRAMAEDHASAGIPAAHSDSPLARSAKLTARRVSLARPRPSVVGWR